MQGVYKDEIWRFLYVHVSIITNVHVILLQVTNHSIIGRIIKPSL